MALITRARTVPAATAAAGTGRTGLARGAESSVVAGVTFVGDHGFTGVAALVAAAGMALVARPRAVGQAAATANTGRTGLAGGAESSVVTRARLKGTGCRAAVSGVSVAVVALFAHLEQAVTAYRGNRNRIIQGNKRKTVPISIANERGNQVYRAAATGNGPGKYLELDMGHAHHSGW